MKSPTSTFTMKNLWILHAYRKFFNPTLSKDPYNPVLISILKSESASRRKYFENLLWNFFDTSSEQWWAVAVAANMWLGETVTCFLLSCASVSRHNNNKQIFLQPSTNIFMRVQAQQQQAGGHRQDCSLSQLHTSRGVLAWGRVGILFQTTSTFDRNLSLQWRHHLILMWS